MVLQPVVAMKKPKSKLGYVNLGLPKEYADSESDSDGEEMTWSATGSGASGQQAGLKSVEDEFNSYAFHKSPNIEVDGDILQFWQVICCHIN